MEPASRTRPPPAKRRKETGAEPGGEIGIAGGRRQEEAGYGYLLRGICHIRAGPLPCGETARRWSSWGTGDRYTPLPPLLAAGLRWAAVRLDLGAKRAWRIGLRLRNWRPNWRRTRPESHSLDHWLLEGRPYLRPSGSGLRIGRSKPRRPHLRRGCVGFWARP